MRGTDRSYQVKATSSRDEFAALDARRELEQDEAIADESEQETSDKSIGRVVVILSLSDVKQIKHHVDVNDDEHSWAVTNGKLGVDQLTVYLTGTVNDLVFFAARVVEAALKAGD